MDDEQVIKEAKQYVSLLKKDGVNAPVDKDVDSYTMELPEWYNEALFKRAQRFYFNNMYAVTAGKLFGLLAVLSVPSILKILIYTNASSMAVTAYKRYLETVFHTLTWYSFELKPGSRSWKSLASVRKGHIIASKFAEKGKSGIITQRDMALTQFGFMGYIVLMPEKLGCHVDREDFEAFVHFWRVIGYMVGIQEQYNLCTDSLDSTRVRLQLVLDEFYRPWLENHSTKFYQMADALINGLWCLNPALDTNASLFITKWLSNCKNYVYFPSDPKLLHTNPNERQAVFDSLANFAFFRWYFNLQVWLAHYIIYYFPFLAIFKFGLSNSYVRILKGVK